MIQFYNCQNCGPILGPLRSEFPNIPDLGQRVAPGEPVPEGECPHCEFGALVHLLPPPVSKQPKDAPAAILGLIACQPPEIQAQLLARPDTHRGGAWTICLRDEPRIEMGSKITTTEYADLTLEPGEDGLFSEGKPGIDECFTEYRVGDILLVVPEGFSDEANLDRYQ